MVVTRGLNDEEPQAAYRQDICQFADDRLSIARKLEFVHRLLGREMAEVRMFLDSIEEYFASLPRMRGKRRQLPARSTKLRAIARRGTGISSLRATPTNPRSGSG